MQNQSYVRWIAKQASHLMEAAAETGNILSIDAALAAVEDEATAYDWPHLQSDQSDRARAIVLTVCPIFA